MSGPAPPPIQATGRTWWTRCGRRSPASGPSCRRQTSAFSFPCRPLLGGAPAPRAARNRPPGRRAHLGGRLSVHRGRVVAVANQRGCARLRIDHGGSATELAVGWLVNCTGPAPDITATADPLLRHLLKAGLVRPDPLRLGLDTDPRGALRDADGRAAGDIFALGPLLRGSRYETTAIPEIRGQAAALARHLLTRQGDARPGSAA